ncbi:ATP-binding protein [Chitinophaga nivalis]|uniref:ATP-binding protein n=1 Tax=Chitinophaga nivalis TaxID=2991709 RepID=A0ABT3ISF8_9BACT|nr:ATP-binding protein [Chitinophaga nivalis]MCW3463406.1 ATP-binding protein [Chitinophaga nivalis]MCW3486904.1 ATP-binding protein [Chitinophaga nivalis]
MSLLLYNPDRKNKHDFIAEFVIRTRIFEEIFADIRSGKMATPEQHYLLLGQRGAGKTTLLLRLKYAIEDDVQLSQWLIPVIFSEEQHNIGELGNLWEKIAEYLEENCGFEGLVSEMEPYVKQDNYEAAALRVLLKHLNQQEKKLVLFVDNMGQLLRKFGELEVRRLREVLQTIPHFRLIAGSPVVLESILDYQQPLFEFFKMIQLKDLTDEECIVLLRKFAVLYHQETTVERIIAKKPARISAFRELSGGVPRTMSLLFNVFVDNAHGNVLSDLEKVLDMVTPLYKHQMDDLPPQQQKIVDAVALHWYPVEVKELTKKVRLDSKVISAQLRQLEKNQVIEKIATGTKNHQYRLRERFFNIWYLMRYGRKQGRYQMICVVKFLEALCDTPEIERRIRSYIKEVNNNGLDTHIMEIFGLAYTFFEQIDPEVKMLLKENTPPYIADNVTFTDQEFNRLLKNACKKKEYIKFIKLSINRELTTAEQKDQYLDIFEQLTFDCLSGIGKAARTVFEDKTLQRNQQAHNYFVFSFVINWAYKTIYMLVTEKNDTALLALVKNITNEKVIQHVTFSSLNEIQLYMIIIYTFIAGEYYEFARKVAAVFPVSKTDGWDIEKLIDLCVKKEESIHSEAFKVNKGIYSKAVDSVNNIRATWEKSHQSNEKA